MPSEQLTALRGRLDELCSVLLPAFDPVGNYPAQQITKTLAYRVLTHAEIECFIENWVRDIAIQAVKSWKKTALATRPLICLVGFSGRMSDLPGSSLAPPQESKKSSWEEMVEIDSRIDAAVSAFIGRVALNHGVKEENLLALLLPVGIRSAEIDPQLLVELNSFGSERGESAHKGISHIKVVPDPRTEYDRICRISTMLSVLDASLVQLMTDCIGA